MHRSRLALEHKMGRKLYPGECVAHADGNLDNLDPENMLYFPNYSERQMFYNSRKLNGYESNKEYKEGKITSLRQYMEKKLGRKLDYCEVCATRQGPPFDVLLFKSPDYRNDYFRIIRKFLNLGFTGYKEYIDEKGYTCIDILKPLDKGNI